MRPCSTSSTPPSPRPRLVELPDGRELVVRPVARGDVDGLVALYAGLSRDDRYRRFFSVWEPPRRFVERMVTVSDRGGCGLVVTVAGGWSATRLVAEASYNLLPNGNGELGMTVATDWRGWLGPYLLDALITAARDQGVPNLEADVLVTNRPMLALVHGRPWATMGHDNWTITRVLIGVASRVPTWPDAHPGPRLLVEGGGGRWRAEDEARTAGFAVLICPGPTTRSGCPAMRGIPCPLADGADAIVVAPTSADPAWEALAAAHRTRTGRIPVLLDHAVPGRRYSHIRELPAGDADAVEFLQRSLPAGDVRP